MSRRTSALTIALSWATLMMVLFGGLGAAEPSAQGVSLNLRHSLELRLDAHRGPEAVAFEIGAAPVTGLYPGATKPMKLVIVNPTRFDLRIESLAGTVRSTTRPGCAPTPTNLVVRPRVGPPTLPMTVPAYQRREAGSVTLYMPNTVADACQGTVFDIRFQGSGAKVHK
ncbi:hypothetical protein Val02_81620 [Virgisporangium aliadipatigenens]|uniref:Uncharacterized protein n=1 Tax=Virgisporangium aliadipatigenens TaxID=741659 RepID=A0A8J3YWY2_9ACTN|nr:hypothetical protein [Virgisporangium aliadipatigenens]GIJ51276.1 hypothetical protein Val02_81620 [Virgisporangium aliadipatigenens]